MRKETEPTEIGKRYAAAHRAHHETKDLREALELYTAIIAAHSETPEAGYSRSQVQNMVNTVVPKQELFDAQVALLSGCLARMSSTDVAPAHVTP